MAPFFTLFFQNFFKNSMQINLTQPESLAAQGLQICMTCARAGYAGHDRSK